jgi:translation initiation factor IF-2
VPDSDVWWIYTRTVPIVVVFTKYDRLVWSKKKELEEDNVNLGPEDLNQRGEEEAKKVLDTCIESVENALRRLGLKEQTIRHANVSSMFSHP